ncbi:MAG: hypothetical protein FJW20_13215 [Acidimicrobiia bacterium]|nr:hypothetical protein [Acidimicrobiia bacterium]
MSASANYCRVCGKALSEQERETPGAIYCSACAPSAAQPPPPPPAQNTGPAITDPSISPGLAFLLGLIPGVGAIYNGQYAKGLVHVVVFGLLISIAASDNAVGDLGPLIGLMIPAWVLYMAFEAYHTAKRRCCGERVDEFSSLVPLKSNGKFPAAPILLMAVGVVLLLHNLEFLRISDILKFWPAALIALGAYMLYLRLGGAVEEVKHE